MLRPSSVVFLLLMPVAALAGSAQIDSLWNADQRDLALERLVAETEQAAAAGDTVLWVDNLVHQGRLLKNLDQPAAAEDQLRRALTLVTACGDSALACAPHRWLGVVLSAQGRNDEALQHYHRVVDLAHAVGDTVHEAWGNIGLGWDADIRRDHPGARDCYARAAVLFEAAGDGEGALWANLGHANAFFHLGQYDRAAGGWDHVAAIARQEGFARHEAITRNNIAGLQFALGRPDIALAQYDRAVAVWDSLGQAWERMPPSLNRASCLTLLGRADEARELLNRELEACRQSEFADYEARALRKLAELEKDLGHVTAARALFREALALGDERPVLERVDVLTGLAALDAGVGDHAAALATLDRAEALLTDDTTSQIRLRLDLVRATSLLALDRTDEAQRHLDHADEIMGSARARQGLELELLRASLHEIRQQPDAALASLEAAADLWEQERSLPLDPDWREERGSSGHAIFARLGLTLLDRDGATAAFDRLQIAKARTLRERLQGPGAAPLPEATVPTLAQLQSEVLQPGELLLDAYVGPSGGLLLAATTDTCVASVLPESATLSDQLQRWRALLTDPTSSADQRQQAADQLREQILAPVDGLLAQATRILVCPDGVLHLAPLSLLADDHAATWTRIPSTAILADLRTSAAPELAGTVTSLLALTADASTTAQLTGAEWQADQLAARWQHAVRLHLDAPDTSALHGHGIIHVGAHVRADDHNAWQSAILVGGDEFDAVDIAAMELDARLVVLASCGSATGRVISGEGVQGLASAFLAAGVPSVVASLWPVDDDLTALLMDRFYHHLSAGVRAADALDQARRDLRDDPATSHPLAWAGFVLVGDGDTQVRLRPQQSNNWLWRLPLAAAALAGLVGTFVVQRRRERTA